MYNGEASCGSRGCMGHDVSQLCPVSSPFLLLCLWVVAYVGISKSARPFGRSILDGHPLGIAMD